MTKEEIQELRTIMKETVNEELAPLKEKLDEIQESLNEVRSSTNSLIEWADEVAVISQVRFPVKKAK